MSCLVALNVLKEMSAGVEDLRERVATAELLGDRVPVEVQVKSIQAGMQSIYRAECAPHEV